MSKKPRVQHYHEKRSFTGPDYVIVVAVAGAILFAIVIVVALLR
jgi:hypothetical protein